MKQKTLLTCSLLLVATMLMGCGPVQEQNRQFIITGEIYEATLKSVEMAVVAGWFNDEQLKQINTLLPAGESCFDSWHDSLVDPNALPYDRFLCATTVIRRLIELEQQAEGRPQ